MTKYPIKHTMEFGEKGYGDWWCSNCEEALAPSRVTYQERCDTCGHPVVWVEGTIPLSVTFDLVKDCPKCKGAGEFWDKHIHDPNYDNNCPHCSDNGLPDGKVHRYWTPEEAAEHIKKETGIDNWDPGTVWCLRADIKVTGVLVFGLDGYSWSLSTWEGRGNNYIQLLVAFPGQPAPPADYRPG